MELINDQDQSIDKKEYYLSFYGDGSRYLGIVIVNLLLTVVTLGLYYPWAKAKLRKYLWNETELDGSRFVFHGTGKEMFKGFIIAYVVIFVLLAIHPFLYFLGIFVLVPFALFGGYRYRMSRTSWRGIHFGFDGKFGPFLKLCIVNLILTIVTFGIYGFWMHVNLRRYFMEHTTFGHLRLGFSGDGGDLLGIGIGGYFASIFSIGLFVPAWVRWNFNYLVDNTYISDGEYRQKCISHLSIEKVYSVMLINFLLIVVTLGLAFPWVMMRSMRMYFNSVDLPEIFDLDDLEQNAEAHTDAVGDDLLDIFDMGLDF